jgi:hypothetical protein
MLLDPKWLHRTGFLKAAGAPNDECMQRLRLSHMTWLTRALAFIGLHLAVTIIDSLLGYSRTWAGSVVHSELFNPCATGIDVADTGKPGVQGAAGVWLRVRLKGSRDKGAK